MSVACVLLDNEWHSLTYSDLTWLSTTFSDLSYSPEEAAGFVEPLRSALWMEHGVSLLLPPGSPPPTPLTGSLSWEERQKEIPRSNPVDPETKASASHELAGSSPFSGDIF